jgi:hypothetical protein
MPDEMKMVYILGAGCSAGELPNQPGFPLASEFLRALEDFIPELSDGCGRLKTCVMNTINLLHHENAPTLDTLVARLGTAAHDFSQVMAIQERQKLRRQIYEARIATAALFLQLERKAQKTGLPRYSKFLDELFGNSTDWTSASKKSGCDVLTFNYDRLFEMAFLSRFRGDAGQHPLYGKLLLNSGLDFVQGHSIDFDPNRFSFLKLHGSVGIRARNENSRNCPDPCIWTYCDGLPGADAKPINDDRFFALSHDPNPFERDPEPMIVFPHEKPSAMLKQVPSRNYIEGIWQEAKRRLATAANICAIGYSFSEMDRSGVLDLMKSAKNCKRLLVQNRPGMTEQICERLRRKWFEPAGLELEVVPFSQPF